MIDSSLFVLGAPNPLIFIFVVLVVVLPIGLLIGAVILRASVSLFNKFAGYEAGGPDEVPEPSMLKAMGILLVSSVFNFIIGLVMGVLIAGLGLAEEGANPLPGLLINLASVPFTFLITSALLAGLLPTTFARGMGVALCQYIVTILLGIVIFGFIFLVGLLTGAV